MLRPQTKTINITLLNGGVGDHMASLVAVDYILRKYPWITPLIWIPDLLVELAKDLLPEHAQVFSFSDMRGKYDPSKPTKTTEWDGYVSPMKIHSLEYAFLKLCDELPPMNERNYLKLKSRGSDMPKRYVVITTGFTADVREFRSQFVNEVAEFVKSTQREVIFIGSPQAKTGSQHTITATFDKGIDFSNGIDLIGKTSLLEAAQIMASADAVVGVDNGLLHVAGCSDVAIVGGFTTVSPFIRMPVRHDQLGWNYAAVIPDESLECTFCQQKTNFLYGHNYTNCLHKGKTGHQYKVNLCTQQMRSEKFIGHLEDLLEG